MTGILYDWLGPALEHEISEGLEWRKENPESKAKIRHSQALEEMYRDDGSNLRFKLEPSDRSSVQVLDLVPDQHTAFVDTTVSDSFTSVKARFSSAYVAAFQKTQGRSFKESIEGAIFDLKEFEIVVDYSGGASGADTVVIRIVDADFKGSSGSPKFGKPTLIHQRCKIQMLLEKLQNPSDEDVASQYGASQSRRSSLDNSHFAETQFATQVSGSLRPRKKAGKLLSGPQNNSQLGQATVATGSKDPTALLGLLLRSNGSTRQHSNDIERENQSGTICQSPSLVKIKTEPADLGQAEPKVAAEKAEIDSRMDFDGPEPYADVAVPSVESPGQFQQDGANDSPPAAMSAHMRSKIENQSLSPVPTLREQPFVNPERFVQKAQELTNMEVDDAPTSFQAPPPGTHFSVLPNSSAAVTVAPLGVNSMGSSQLKNLSLPSSTSVAGQSSESNARSSASQYASQKLVSSSGPWKGTLSISRAIGHVTQGQEDILSKSESWLPPGPGKTFPWGNVPGPVLALLSDRAEKLANAQQSQELPGPDLPAMEHHNSKTDHAEVVNRNENDVEDEGNLPLSMPSSAVSWTESPEHPVKRWADVENEPDSSGQQSSGKHNKRMAVLDIPPSSAQSGVAEASTNRFRFNREQTEDAQIQDNANISSSPPALSSHPPMASYRHEHNGEDDLEMSPPKPLPTTNPQLSQNPRRTSYAAAIPLEEEYASEAEEVPFVAEEPLAGSPRSSNRNFMARHHIASSSNPQPSGHVFLRPEMPLHAPYIIRQVSAIERELRFDGVADSQPSSDNEDDLIVRQIQNEIESQASLQSKRSTKGSNNERKPFISHERTQDANLHSDHVVQPSQGRERGTRATPMTYLADNGLTKAPSPSVVPQAERSTKRAQASPSPEQCSSKRPKVFHAEYGFSQEDLQLENPKYQLMEQRKEHKRSYRQRKKADVEDSNEVPSSPLNQTENVGAGAAVAVDAQSLDKLSLPPTESHVLPPGQQQESGHKAPEGPILNQSSASTLSKPPAQSTPSHVSNMLRDDVFAQFQAAYSEYGGDRTHFTRICRKIQELPKGFHYSFWDDFVIRYLTDFGKYQSKCRDEVVESLSYNDYYFKVFYEEVDKPKFNRRILTPSTLKRVLELETQPERVSPQQRVRSRSPAMEERRTGDDFRTFSSTYRQRSPFCNRSVNPTTSRPRSRSWRESLSASPRDSERKDSFVMTERRDTSANGRSITSHREKSPSSYAGPASMVYGSANRREPLSGRRQDSERTLSFRGDSYRPKYASPSHAPPGTLKQQHKDLVLRDSPSRRAEQNLLPRGPSSAQSSPQQAAATPRPPTSQALVRTNAKHDPYLDEELRKNNVPASANTIITPSTARRGGRGGRGRGRGGFSNPREVGRGDRVYAVDNPSPAPAFMAGPDGGHATTPTKVKTGVSAAIDLTKSSPATTPSMYAADHDGSRGRGKGGFVSEVSDRSNDTAPAPAIKTGKPVTAPAATGPKESDGFSGSAGGGEERGRCGFPPSCESVDPRRSGGGSGSNPSTARPPSLAPPSTGALNTTTLGAASRATLAVDASHHNTIQTTPSASSRNPAPPPPASASSLSRASMAASPARSEGGAKKSGNKKTPGLFATFKRKLSEERKRRESEGCRGGGGDGASGSPAATK